MQAVWDWFLDGFLRWLSDYAFWAIVAIAIFVLGGIATAVDWAWKKLKRG